MNICNNPGVSAATAAAQSPSASSIQILVLSQALNMQAANANALLQAIPRLSQLATSGSIGTKLNTYA
jgi:hypothetical protein